MKYEVSRKHLGGGGVRSLSSVTRQPVGEVFITGLLSLLRDARSKL
jgi:hypothetical protein